MFTTLAAVVALALGHVAPAAAASLRRFDGFRRWLAGWTRMAERRGRHRPVLHWHCCRRCC